MNVLGQAFFVSFHPDIFRILSEFEILQEEDDVCPFPGDDSQLALDAIRTSKRFPSRRQRRIDVWCIQSFCQIIKMIVKLTFKSREETFLKICDVP